MRFWPKKKWKQALLIVFLAIIIVIPVAFGVLSYVNREPTYKNGATGTLTVTSPTFQNGAAIPTQYTAMGDNVNPPLNVTGIPEGTKSLVVTVTDPIIPGVYSWTHWVSWNLPVQNITENTPLGVQGKNSWNRNGYGGPDPMGQRTYTFTVYALDETLDLPAGSAMGTVLRAMDNHVIAKGQLIGTSTK